MCYSCFKKYTDAPVVNERVVAACRLIRARGDEADYSPLLHIHVADMHLEDHWFDLPDPEGYPSGPSPKQRYDEATDWERAIFDTLAALTEAERATALAMEWGYLDEAGNPLTRSCASRDARSS